MIDDPADTARAPDWFASRSWNWRSPLARAQLGDATTNCGAGASVRVMMASVTSEASCDALSDLEALYRGHGTELVRLAALALGDRRAAEEVVQDVFTRLHRGGLRVEDSTRAPAYLRSAVLNGCRSRQRRAGAGDRAWLRLARERPPEADVERSAIDASVRAEVMAAIRALPARQRDCVLLRYYLDLSEAEIAATLGISVGTVKSSTARARKSLASVLEGVR